jgi:hypothetical protein
VAQTLTKDVGLGGLRCISQVLTPVGQEMEVELTLPASGEQVRFQGKTVWFRLLPESEQVELGIAFVGAPEEVTRRLAAYLERFSHLNAA